MKHSEIQKAIVQAKLFLLAAKAVKQTNYQGRNFDSIEVGKESGALRRASMDLTRSLAEMRKP